MTFGISVSTLKEARDFTKGVMCTLNKDGTQAEKPGWFRRGFLFMARIIGSLMFFGAFGLVAYDVLYLGLPFVVAALDGLIVLAVSLVFLYMEEFYTRAAAGIWLVGQSFWNRKPISTDDPNSAWAPFLSTIALWEEDPAPSSSNA